MIKENKNKEVFEFLIKEKRVSYIEVNDKIYVLQKLFPIDIFGLNFTRRRVYDRNTLELLSNNLYLD